MRQSVKKAKYSRSASRSESNSDESDVNTP